MVADCGCPNKYIIHHLNNYITTSTITSPPQQEHHHLNKNITTSTSHQPQPHTHLNLTPTSTSHHPIPPQLEQASIKIFKALKGCGYARADFRINKDGVPQFLELNPNAGVLYPPGQYASADFILQHDPLGHTGARVCGEECGSVVELREGHGCCNVIVVVYCLLHLHIHLAHSTCTTNTIISHTTTQATSPLRFCRAAYTCSTRQTSCTACTAHCQGGV